MSADTCLIITSIASAQHEVLAAYAQLCHQQSLGFIVAGDKKSPQEFDLPGCDFLSSQQQKTMPFQLAPLLPDNHYSRKNMGYLHAIKAGYAVIRETDDDNLPLADFWRQPLPELSGQLQAEKTWINVYAYFSETGVWPRGFRLNDLELPAPNLADGLSTHFCPIQQGLADENPDVDAIYRLGAPLPVYFRQRSPVILGPQSICPFNSQNTTWFKEAFPLLYLPSFCSFRVTDIWRSFVAQRILWTCNWHLAFLSPTVYQKRNAHNLMLDLQQEVSGYVYNGQLMDDLCALSLKPGPHHLCDNLLSCYELLVQKNYLPAGELPLVKAWISDIQQLLGTAG